MKEPAFVTKAGHVGVAYHVRGLDYEGLTHSQRAAFVHRWEAALRVLDEHYRVYQYVLKRTVDPIIAASCAQPVAHDAIQQRTAYLNSRRSDLCEFELYCVVLQPAAHLSCGGGAAPDRNQSPGDPRAALRVHVLSMKEPPSQTFAHLLGDLYAIPGEFIACLEWQRIPSDRMRRDVQSRRRHFFNKRVALVNYIAPESRPDEMLVDDSASATVHQLGDALTEIEVRGHFFGRCSLTLVLHGTDARALEHQAAEAMKVVAVHDGALFDESYNLLNAWLSIVPGNSAHNLRRLALLETNLADLSFLFTLDQGERISPHLRREALALFETPHHTPYAFNLHVDDVGHTLVLGATGSGKSFLLNFLVTHAQQYDPLTVILDLGHSYRKLATLLRGRYLEIGLRHADVTINPFALEPTPEHLHFLHAFVRVLLEGHDGYRLSELEDREVYDAVENVYVLDESQRRLFTVANLLPRGLAGRLHKWVDGGRYASLFDNLQDTLTVDRLQVFECGGSRPPWRNPQQGTIWLPVGDANTYIAFEVSGVPPLDH